jgi:glycosyltransferase involved in cell wall biosynthesis
VLVAHPSPDTYGSDRQMVESVNGLRAAGWDVTVCLPRTGPLVDLLGSVPTRTTAFPVLRKSLLRPLALLVLALRAPRDLLRLVRMIRRVRPDVVYVNTVTIPWWIVAARLAGKPVVVHVHEAEDGVPKPFRLALSAPLLLATSIVTNSATSASVAVAEIPRLARRIKVVPNGIPDHGPAPADAILPGQLVFVGRLAPRKGVDVALEALALLRAQDRDVRLEICGTAFEGYSWYEAELRRRAADPDLAGAVRFAGYVYPTDAALARASVVLVPSRVEPFGNTAVEAMFAQRPLVASRVQGLAEIVEDGRTGMLVPPEDPTALADAIARLLDDPLSAARVAAAARADAERRFTVERYRADIAAAVSCLVQDTAQTPAGASRQRAHFAEPADGAGQQKQRVGSEK